MKKRNLRTTTIKATSYSQVMFKCHSTIKQMSKNKNLFTKTFKKKSKTNLRKGQKSNNIKSNRSINDREKKSTSTSSESSKKLRTKSFSENVITVVNGLQEKSIIKANKFQKSKIETLSSTNKILHKTVDQQKQEADDDDIQKKTLRGTMKQQQQEQDNDVDITDRTITSMTLNKVCTFFRSRAAKPQTQKTTERRRSCGSITSNQKMRRTLTKLSKILSNVSSGKSNNPEDGDNYFDDHPFEIETTWRTEINSRSTAGDDYPTFSSIPRMSPTGQYAKRQLREQRKRRRKTATSITKSIKQKSSSSSSSSSKFTKSKKQLLPPSQRSCTKNNKSSRSHKKYTSPTATPRRHVTKSKIALPRAYSRSKTELSSSRKKYEISQLWRSKSAQVFSDRSNKSIRSAYRFGPRTSSLIKSVISAPSRKSPPRFNSYYKSIVLPRIYSGSNSTVDVATSQCHKPNCKDNSAKKSQSTKKSILKNLKLSKNHFQTTKAKKRQNSKKNLKTIKKE